MENEGDYSEGSGRAIFMAFGTKGDVFPIAAIAAAFASDQINYSVTLVTHLAHQTLSEHLTTWNVSYIPVSTSPVVSVDQAEYGTSFSELKKSIQKEHRQQCLDAVAKVFGDGPCMAGDFILINFFALEGWHLAELFQVECVIAAPYVVPYSAPSSFEHHFMKELPQLYKYLQEASDNTVGWKDICHWMWPLFTEDWGSWRSDCLNLSPIPFTDPVTNLPIRHLRLQSPLLIYGFSNEIVEHPGYWPSNAHICGFWFLPIEWQFSCNKCSERWFCGGRNSLPPRNVLCESHIHFDRFLSKTSSTCSPIFIGLSSIGSMGFLKNPSAFLKVLKTVIESTSYTFILFSAGYEPLNSLIESSAEESSNLADSLADCKEGNLLFNEKLYCYSGSIPYSWFFSRCAVTIHHGGSGSTAAALHAGIPQIICPFILDQFYWAERLHWIGVAPEPLERRHLVPDTDDSTSIKEAAVALARAINLALSPAIKERASEVGKRISSEDGLGEALKLLKQKVLSQNHQQKHYA